MSWFISMVILFLRMSRLSDDTLLLLDRLLLDRLLLDRLLLDRLLLDRLLLDWLLLYWLLCNLYIKIGENSCYFWRIYRNKLMRVGCKIQEMKCLLNSLGLVKLEVEKSNGIMIDLFCLVLDIID